MYVSLKKNSYLLQDVVLLLRWKIQVTFLTCTKFVSLFFKLLFTLLKARKYKEKIDLKYDNLREIKLFYAFQFRSIIAHNELQIIKRLSYLNNSNFLLTKIIERLYEVVVCLLQLLEKQTLGIYIKSIFFSFKLHFFFLYVWIYIFLIKIIIIYTKFMHT